ncbi:RNA ligase family protein [Paenibacillus sp. S-38]|uniref:ATP-dependent DNA ligase n=1 Tax=Paenibacillus sp. S-38 TaxID=3416710 RepID=UPI003CE7DF2E
MINPLKPMLLHKADTPPAGAEYWHQIKWDGHRCVLYFIDGKVHLFTRHQTNCTQSYPELQGIQLNAASCILDGEMIVLQNGVPCFESVMERFHAGKNIKWQMEKNPVHFVAFDILQVNGEDLSGRPLSERHVALNKVVKQSNIISISQYFTDGTALFSKVKEKGLEGIVSKKIDSRYTLDHRSQSWLKVKNYLYTEAAISGIRKKEFGWSLIDPVSGKYLGVCEFADPESRKAFHHIAKQLVVREDKNWIWIKPLIKARVKFQCWTKNGLMRTPSFQEFLL